MASDGDIVFVYSGIYYENVVVNKSINLTGENKGTTIIDGQYVSDVVEVTSDWVNISGFTVNASGDAWGDAGINLNYVQHCRVNDTIATDCKYGIFLYFSENNTLGKNEVYQNRNPYFGNGFYFYTSSNNIITKNQVSSNYNGFFFTNFSNSNTFNLNTISQNMQGIHLHHCSYNLIYENTFFSNTFHGVKIRYQGYNIVYHNNFFDNNKGKVQGYDDAFNFWDDGYPNGGNFWLDYTGSDNFRGPEQNLPGSDGIGDTPYIIDSDSQDNYPLMAPAPNSPPILLPPTLYINVSQDQKDVVLSWDPPPNQEFDPYLIYRSEDPNDFDFDNPWIDTLIDKEPGELVPIPERTMWNDTNAAFPGNETNYKEKYYYVIRAYNNNGEFSRTSRTVGKWTRSFSSGISAFSLPLQPIESLYTDYLVSDMNADYIKYMNSTTHVWEQHNLGDGDINNSQMKLGEGYEVKLNNPTTYTFTGMPVAMINFDNDTGFSGFDPATDAKSLSVSIEDNGDVNLTWDEPVGMNPGDWYNVYCSNTRDGFFGRYNLDYFLACPYVYFGKSNATHTGAMADDPGTRLYYMVVPYNANGVMGSSTYSVGIWTEEYLSQYDTFGIPLKMNDSYSANWYCDNIPNTVGMNYFIYNEQRWGWHSERMPAEAYDPILQMTEGYQISTTNNTIFIFIGV